MMNRAYALVVLALLLILTLATLIVSTSHATLTPQQLQKAQRIAQQYPLFGIAGVDMNALRSAIDSLEEAQNKLAAAQMSSDDSEYVRSALYPIAFLRSLVVLEENRVQFIHSGTADDEERYGKALRHTIATGKSDVQKFRTAYLTVAGPREFRFIFPSSEITKRSFVQSIDDIQRRFTEASTMLTARTECIRNDTQQCPLPEMQAPIESRFSSEAASRAIDIRNIFAEMYRNQSIAQHPIIVLSTSSCLSGIASPYPFIAGQNDGTVPVRSIGNIFYYPTTTTNGLGAFLKKKFDTTYIFFDPTFFYACPDVQTDVGTFTAVQETAAFARAHPSIALSARAPLLSKSPFIYEPDARAYIDALATSTSDEMTPEATILRRMFAEGSGGLDALIRNIALADEIDLKLKQNGAPVDVRARELFLTHSAAQSLLLSNNSSAGITEIHLRENINAHRATTFPSYDIISKNSPRNAILRDMRAFDVLAGFLNAL